MALKNDLQLGGTTLYPIVSYCIPKFVVEFDCNGYAPALFKFHGLSTAALCRNRQSRG